MIRMVRPCKRMGITKVPRRALKLKFMEKRLI
jgi:hypothetical protein